MPTQPDEHVLSRELSKIEWMVNITSPVLQEVVNYSTHIYQKCQQSEACKSDEYFPVLAMYLHVIQMTDSAEVLISNGCIESTNVLLRSSFEARLSIGYLLEKDCAKRAYSWMVNKTIDSIKDLQSIDPDTSKGQEFENTIKREGLDRDIPGFPVIRLDSENSKKQASEAILKYQESLKKPGYAEAYAEYTRLTKKLHRHPEWYSYYDGPQNLRQLANHLNQGTRYEILYVGSSKISHANDIDHLIIRFEDGTTALGQIRNPLNFPHVSTTSIALLLESSQMMLNKFRSYDLTSFQKWLKKEVIKRYMYLTNLTFDQVEKYDAILKKKL
jgi:hypothetical protein